MKTTIRTGAVLLAAALAVAAASSVSAADPKTVFIQPHKALYDITLRSAKSSTGIADIHGQMFYDLRGTCDAWETTHRFVLTYDYIDNPSSQVVSEFKTVESRDGQRFEYTARRIRDGELQEEVSGKVDRPAEGSGKKFQAQYKSPETKAVPLPDDTLFPVAHSKMVIADALNNQKFIRGHIFDGSDADGPYQISGLVLKPISEPERRREWPRSVDKDLAGRPGWRTQVAIFPQATDDESSSDYEMDVNLGDSGIVTDMAVRYADFTIVQKLKALSENPAPACTKDGKPVVTKDPVKADAEPAPLKTKTKAE